MTYSTRFAQGAYALSILFEDSDLVVIDKPSGIVVNKSDTTKDETTIQDLIFDKIDQSTGDKEEDFIKRGGIVHRLDKETSGVLIVAKNNEAFIKLQDQFKNRLVEKEYIALAHGEIKPENGEINVPVGRLPWNRERFGILPGGRESKTRYSVISYSQGLTLLKLFPETGRTHQIRVHLKYLNHPIFSDPLYAGRKTSRNDRKTLERVFLHAHSIKFNHPRTGKRMIVESSLPKELQKVLNLLKFNYGGDR